MSLHVEVSGSGPDIVLLHGWGLHGGMFAPLAECLGAAFRVHAVDLPGHGRSRDAAARGLRAWTAAVSDSVPARAVWLGWSLGGLIALRATLDTPARVARLVLVAATPRFVSAPDWPDAQPLEVLARLAGELAGDFRAVVSRFLALQALGDADARNVTRRLRAHVFDHGEPDPFALADGLAILRDTDLRPDLPAVSVPTLVVAGQHDRLAPPGASRALAAAVPGAALEIVPRASHAPFLADPAAFAARIAGFAHGG